MVNQGVAADDGADFFHAAVVGDQFAAGGHVDAVDVGKAHRRRGAGQVDAARTGVARHLHNLFAGGAAHDGVVHQQHIAALELAGNHVELLAHRFFAHRLPRHDEGAAHVAVFHKAFAVGQTQQLRQLRRTRAAGLGDGNDHVNIARRHGGHHTLGQGLAQIKPRLVDRNPVHHRVRAGQVNELKNAGVERGRVGALLGQHFALQVDKHRLAGVDIALKLVQRAFQRHRLAGQHHVVRAAAHAQGANAMRVAKSQYAVAGNERNHRVRTFHPQVHIAHRRKQVFGQQRHATAGALQLMGQHVEQHLGITVGVDVAVVVGEQLALERVRVGQVAVVHQHDAKRGVHIKGLRFFLAVGVARCGVAHLAQAAVAGQRAHIAGAKHVFDHALGLVHKELALLLGDDARSILAAVLQEQQGVINELVHRCVADNADDSTHGFWSTRSGKKFRKSVG